MVKRSRRSDVRGSRKIERRGKTGGMEGGRGVERTKQLESKRKHTRRKKKDKEEGAETQEDLKKKNRKRKRWVRIMSSRR